MVTVTDIQTMPAYKFLVIWQELAHMADGDAAVLHAIAAKRRAVLKRGVKDAPDHLPRPMRLAQTLADAATDGMTI